MTEKHIHLIGICGTAMASLAGMLQGARLPRDRLRRRRLSSYVRFPARAGYSRRATLRRKNLEPRPDLVVVGNAIRAATSNWSMSSTSASRFARCRSCFTTNSCVGKEVLVVAGTHGKTTTPSMLAWIFHSAGARSVFPDRRNRGKFWFQFSPGGGQALHPRRRRIRHGVLR